MAVEVSRSAIVQTEAQTPAPDVLEPERCGRDDDRLADDKLVSRARGGEERAWDLIIAKYTAYLASIGWS